MPQFVVLARGMAMFKKRRVKKETQEDLLWRHLPRWVTFHGAFDKSGNYALSADDSGGNVGQAALTALQKHPKLRDLEQVSVILAETARSELAGLVAAVTKRYGKQFNHDDFSLEINGETWRAGLSFLPDTIELREFSWPAKSPPKVVILGATGPTAFFLKREERNDEQRISFGTPTEAVDEALSTSLNRPVAATSRSGRTIRGVLRLFPRGSRPL